MGRIYYACGHDEHYAYNSDWHRRKPCWDCRKARIGQEIRFLRFGAPVEHSRNWTEGRSEAGMSCYEIGADGQPIDTIRCEFAGRVAYIGRGKLLGFGSDDEPLVEVITCRRASKRQLAALGIGAN